MEVTFEIKLLDFITGSWFQTLKNPSTRKIFLFPFLFFLLPFFFWLISAFTGNSTPEFFWRNFFENLGMTMTSIIFMGILMFAIQTIAFMMMMPKGKRNGVACLHTIILDQNDLIEITDVNTQFSDWNGIKSISSLPNCVLIQNNSNQAHIIPKRYFENKNQMSEFVELANFYCQKASKSLSDNTESLIYHRQEEVRKLLQYRNELDGSSRVQKFIDEV